ncbi:MAG: hypothetical protein ACLFUU_10440 [Desulfobacteraceae bacterium]
MEASESPRGPWQVAAFPLIVGWQPESWSLPLYFPDLLVGQLEGQPANTGLHTLPLPPLDKNLPFDWRNYRPGELQQWKAYLEFKASEEMPEDESDLIRAIKGEPSAIPPSEPPPEAGLPQLPDASMIWTLAWQLEKMWTEQEARLKLVQNQQSQLDTWLAPEPWEEKAAFQPPPTQDPLLAATALPDPELALLRLYFWRAILAPHLSHPWAPLILASPSSLGLIPEPPGPRSAGQGTAKMHLTLPGCRDRQGLEQALDQLAAAGLEGQFALALGQVLQALATNDPDLESAQAQLQGLVEQQLWPWLKIENRQPAITLEIRQSIAAEQDLADQIKEVFPGPVLFWRG